MNTHAAIHVGRRQLGLDDETARDLYEQVTGKRSLRAMTDAERVAVVDELRRRGFKAALNRVRRPLEGRYAKKFQALWIAAWNLGLVKNHDDRALIAFAERQTGISHVRFVHDPADADKVIEALKDWMAREAGVVWKKSEIGELGWRWLHRDGAKIAAAQWKILADAGACPAFGGFGAYVRTLVGDVASFADVTDAQWITVMNGLGTHVRWARRRS